MKIVKIPEGSNNVAPEEIRGSLGKMKNNPGGGRRLFSITLILAFTISLSSCIGEEKISIEVGENIQAYVNENPVNTHFLIKSGIHLAQTVKPKDGNTFVGEVGAIMDGGSTPIRYAFHSEANDVTIRNLEIRNYGLDTQHKKHVTYHGVITAAHRDGISENKYARWTVEDCYIHHNRKAGVLVGDGAKVLNCKITHNGQIGLKVYWANSGLVEGNEIAFNNNVDENNETPGTYERYWEAGGTKFAWTKNLIVRDNYVHDNDGPGLWTDIDNFSTLYEGNIVEDNSGIGIFHEISFSAIIRNNEVRRNGYINRGWLWEAGILIAASSNVEVYNNLVENNFNGIVGIQQDRGKSKNLGLEWLLDSVYIHDNIIVMGGNERTGFVTDINCNLFERDISYKNNSYPNQDKNESAFAWNGSLNMNYAEWLEFFPEDNKW